MCGRSLLEHIGVTFHNAIIAAYLPRRGSGIGIFDASVRRIILGLPFIDRILFQSLQGIEIVID